MERMSLAVCGAPLISPAQADEWSQEAEGRQKDTILQLVGDILELSSTATARWGAGQWDGWM